MIILSTIKKYYIREKRILNADVVELLSISNQV